VRTAITAQAHEAVGQNTALQVGVKFFDDIIGQALGSGIGREGGPKGFKMVGDDLVEDRATGLSRLVNGRYHKQTFRRQQLLRSPKRPLLHRCALYDTSIPMSNSKSFLCVADDSNRKSDRDNALKAHPIPSGLCLQCVRPPCV